jgi:hypothetical protein
MVPQEDGPAINCSTPCLQCTLRLLKTSTRRTARTTDEEDAAARQMGHSARLAKEPEIQDRQKWWPQFLRNSGLRMKSGTKEKFEFFKMRHISKDTLANWTNETLVHRLCKYKALLSRRRMHDAVKETLNTIAEKDKRSVSHHYSKTIERSGLVAGQRAEFFCHFSRLPEDQIFSSLSRTWLLVPIPRNRSPRWVRGLSP